MSDAAAPGATVRVACIGAGYWGRNLVRNFAALGVLRRVCEADPTAREAIAREYDVPVTGLVADVFDDPSIDAVAIATPAETHGEIVRGALEAGKHVFVEKPLCLSVAQGEELVALADARDRRLMVGHLLWYHPAIVALRDLVERGELGRIRYIYSNRLNLGRIRREENILWSFAPHDVSVILGLVGEMPSTIQAHGGNYLHERIADVTTTLLSFPSGVKAHIFVSWLHPFKEQKLVVVGERKMAVFNDLDAENRLVLYPHSIDWRNNAPVAQRAEAEPVPIETTEPLRAECAHFVGCVQTGDRPRTDGREALRVLRVLTECQARMDGGGAASAAAVAPGAREPADGLPQGVRGSRPQPDAPFFVHESTYIDDDVEIGAGTTIWHFGHVLSGSRIGSRCRIGQNVVIGPRVSIGDNVKIQNNVSVYEGVELADDVFCGPSMVFTNVYNPRSEIRRMDELRPTRVGRGASFGANCTIVCGTTIGRYAFVGAGAVVTRDVPDFALVVGNPGRIVGWMCRCGHRLSTEPGGLATCTVCGRVYAQQDDVMKEMESTPEPRG